MMVKRCLISILMRLLQFYAFDAAGNARSSLRLVVYEGIFANFTDKQFQSERFSQSRIEVISYIKFAEASEKFKTNERFLS
jgi:hypothetical protein